LGKNGAFLWIFAKKRAFFIKNGLFWAKMPPINRGHFKVFWPVLRLNKATKTKCPEASGHF